MSDTFVTVGIDGKPEPVPGRDYAVIRAGLIPVLLHVLYDEFSGWLYRCGLISYFFTWEQSDRWLQIDMDNNPKEES